MAEGDPTFYDPEEFSRQVLYLSLREMDWLPPRYRIQGEAEFVQTVEIVGKAVFTLQVINRNRLRPLIIQSINLIRDAGDEHGFKEIDKFMAQSHLRSDSVNTILSLFAIIAEIILFFDEIGIPVLPDLYTFPWSRIYEYRLRDEIIFKGGFEWLRDEAKRKYIDTNLYTETKSSFSSNQPIPYAEVRGDLNFPDNPLEFLRERYGAELDPTDVAMDILRKLYHDQGMVPPRVELHREPAMVHPPPPGEAPAQLELDPEQGVVLPSPPGEAPAQLELDPEQGVVLPSPPGEEPSQ